MLKIIAIGGGEIGRPHENGGFYPIETTAIDKEIVKQTGKKHPRLLFIPTASGDSEGYYEVAKKHFSKLGCEVDVLYLLGEKPSKRMIEEKIALADAIYVGGGNTFNMMKAWRKYGVDVMLCKAAKKGIVLSGVSAGAICWFVYGNSDSRKFSKSDAKFIKVTGLGMIDALCCPHYDFEPERQKDLKRMMKNTHRIPAIALDNCTALEVIGDEYRILTSAPNAKAYRTYWKKGEYHKEEIPSMKGFLPLANLLKK
jgi:dipeptidase E